MQKDPVKLTSSARSNLNQGSGPLLIMETAHPQHRGKLTTMYNTLWYVGSIVAAWTVFGTANYSSNSSWRIPVGVQALMPGIMFFGVWFLPESPRWLVSKDRSDEAFKILVKYHGSGDDRDPFVLAEFDEIKETINLEKTLSNQGWQVFLQTQGNRRRLMLIGMVAFFSQ